MGLWCWVTCWPHGSEDPLTVVGGVESPGPRPAVAVQLLRPSPVVTQGQILAERMHQLV